MRQPKGGKQLRNESRRVGKRKEPALPRTSSSLSGPAKQSANSCKTLVSKDSLNSVKHPLHRSAENLVILLANARLAASSDVILLCTSVRKGFDQEGLEPQPPNLAAAAATPAEASTPKGQGTLIVFEPQTCSRKKKCNMSLQCLVTVRCTHLKMSMLQKL